MEALKLVKFWPYRGAMAVGNRTKIPEPLVFDLRVKLFKAAEEIMDNKCTFEVIDGNREVRYISFYDNNAYIGDDVEMRENSAHVREFDNVIVDYD